MEKMTKKIWEITNELSSETYNTINTIKDQSDCFHSEMQGAEQINNLEFNNSDTSTELIPTLMNQLLFSMNNIKNGLIDQITGNNTSIAETTELQNKFLPKGKETLISSLEDTIKNYDNSDNFAAFFAGYITMVIKYDLVPDTAQTYEEFLINAVDRVVEKKEFEDKEKLKAFLKGLSKAIYNSDYKIMQELYDNYDYSITSVYLFCYYMHQYSKNIEDENIFQNIFNIYQRMNDDMSEYVLNLGIYEVKPENKPNKAQFNILDPFQLFPFCYTHSYEEFFTQNLINDVTQYAYEIKSRNLISILSKEISMYKSIMLIQNTNNLSYQWHEGRIERHEGDYGLTKIMHALHIPTILPNMNIFKRLFQANAELEKTNTALVKEQEEKANLVNDFSHRYKNMRTDMLFEISDNLINKCEILLPPEIKDEGVKVLFESEIKQRLTTEADMLNLRFKDKVGMLQTEIKKSIEYSSGKHYSISDIINNAIKRCMITIIHDGDINLADAIIDSYFADYDIESLEKSFDTDVLFKKDCDAIEWLNHNKIVKLNVNISDKWKKFFFVKYQYADNIITDLLVDLIMNILKYADKNQPVFIDFTENDEFMIIESQNVISEYVNNMPGSHQGIKTQNILFNSINNTTDSITYKQESDKFTIKVKIDKQLFGG